MKTYSACVSLTKTYTENICNKMTLQKEFGSDFQAAKKWIDKVIKHFNGPDGIKNLCFVSWYAIGSYDDVRDVDYDVIYHDFFIH